MAAAAYMRLDVARNSDGQWFWRLMSTNGKELCRSAETYTRRGNCDSSARVSLDLLPYCGLGVLKNGETFGTAFHARPPIRVRVLA